MSRAAVGAGAGADITSRESPAACGYLERSERPLASLVFLLPLIVTYEVGTHGWARATGDGESQQIIAFTLLQQFLGLFGATGRHLPALAVAGILIAWHVARNDPWRVRPGTLLGMAVESAVLVVPLVVLGILLARYVPLSSTPLPREANPLVLSLGAGIYEELVFRLMLCTVLTIVLKDVLQAPGMAASLLVVLGSAVAFSAYHYLGSEVFHWRNFAFRTLAGVYFGVLFLVRGFGITAATHAAYDVFILML